MALVQLASIRILMVGLGSEKYAVFVLLASLIGWYSLADAGVGLSLQNYISEKRARNESYSEYVSMAFIISVIQWFLGILFIYFISPVVAPVFLKQFGFLSNADKIRNFFLVGFMFFSITLSNLTYKIWYAEQKGYLANIIPAVASVLGLLGIWLVLKMHIENKLLFSLIAFNSPAMIIGLIFFVLKTAVFSKINLRPGFPVFRQLLHRSGRFFGFALLGLLITQIDYFVISQTVKSNDVVVYNISTKLFSFAFSIYAALLAAWHPVNAEMYVKSEFPKIMKYTKTYLTAGICSITVFTFCFLLFMPKIIPVFSPRENIIIPAVLVVLLGIYFAVRIWNDTFVTLLVSMNKFRNIFIIAPVQVVISASLQIVLASKFGINGIVFGLIFSYLATGAWFFPRLIYKYISVK